MSVGTVRNKWDTSHTELQSNLDTSLHQTTGKQLPAANKHENRSKASFAQIASSIAKANMIVRSIGGLNKKGAGSPMSMTEDQLPGESFVHTLPQAELARVDRLISEQNTTREQPIKIERNSTQPTPAANITRETKRFMATARDFRLTSNYPNAKSHRPKRSDAKTSSDTLPQQSAHLSSIEVPSLKRVGTSKGLLSSRQDPHLPTNANAAYLTSKPTKLHPKGLATAANQTKAFMQTFSNSRPNKHGSKVLFGSTFTEGPATARGSKLMLGTARHRTGFEVSEKDLRVALKYFSIDILSLNSSTDRLLREIGLYLENISASLAELKNLSRSSVDLLEKVLGLISKSESVQSPKLILESYKLGVLVLIEYKETHATPSF